VEELPTPNEEEEKKLAKIQELIQKFNELGEIFIQRYLPEIEKAEKNFKNGYRGEAFLGLAAVLESQMHHLWTFFLLYLTEKYKPFEELLDYNTYTEILWQIEYISSSQRSDLKAFQKGRNTIVHYFSKHLQTKSHPSDKIVKDQFKKGLKISGELTNVLKKKYPKIQFESK
jgi:hypothetical protein